VGDREILETYLNSASKNTSETDIFPHGAKSLLTSVISARNLPSEASVVPPEDEQVMLETSKGPLFLIN
jgi:hypothetical protein